MDLPAGREFLGQGEVAHGGGAGVGHGHDGLEVASAGQGVHLDGLPVRTHVADLHGDTVGLGLLGAGLRGAGHGHHGVQRAAAAVGDAELRLAGGILRQIDILADDGLGGVHLVALLRTLDGGVDAAARDGPGVVADGVERPGGGLRAHVVLAVVEAGRHLLGELEGGLLLAGQDGGAQGDGHVAVLAAVPAVPAGAGGFEIRQAVGQAGGHLLLAVAGEGAREHPHGAARHLLDLLAEQVHGAALRLAGRCKGVEAVGADEFVFLLVADHAAGQVTDDS